MYYLYIFYVFVVFFYFMYVCTKLSWRKEEERDRVRGSDMTICSPFFLPLIWISYKAGLEQDKSLRPLRTAQCCGTHQHSFSRLVTKVAKSKFTPPSGNWSHSPPRLLITSTIHHDGFTDYHKHKNITAKKIKIVQ